MNHVLKNKICIGKNSTMKQTTIIIILLITMMRLIIFNTLLLSPLLIMVWKIKIININSRIIKLIILVVTPTKVKLLTLQVQLFHNQDSEEAYSKKREILIHLTQTHLKTKVHINDLLIFYIKKRYRHLFNQYF